ncbi:uncharacterized protein BX664DRAFT_329292 [Halteromyces radiatus]|uniref:uncharacterized protein n=1 Tax=Halteromyces radiatus TaxID=101107 RepID=UPI00221EEF17|nr:uncharacterized protein BX664DRAFT_329292 [Halteromyces radiatus]KAI8093251.1 hypothetical protein BX664DRAFT_329292 [Halteromyces radiatus]
MHRKKFKEDISPQDDEVLLLSKYKDHNQPSNLLRERYNRNKRKGNPIAIPSNQDRNNKMKGKPTSFSDITYNTYYSNRNQQLNIPRPQKNLVGNMKGAIESKRKVPKESQNESENSTVILSSEDDEFSSGSSRRSKNIERRSLPQEFNETKATHALQSSISPPFLNKKRHQPNQLSTPRRPFSFASGSFSSQKAPLFPPIRNPFTEQLHRHVPKSPPKEISRSLSTSPPVVPSYPTTTRSQRTQPEINPVSRHIIFDDDDDDNDNDDHNDNDNDDNNNNTPSTKSQATNHSHSTDEPSYSVRTMLKDNFYDYTTPGSKDRIKTQPSSLTTKRQQRSTGRKGRSTIEKTSDLRDSTMGDESLDTTPVELSDEEMGEMSDTILFTYPVDRSKGSITITVEDQTRLEPTMFLNDSIIDFYLKWLMDSYSGINKHYRNKRRNRRAVEQTHIFSSFFYNRLIQGSEKSISYENVKKWTSKINLFGKKYAIFPINENWHWYLVLVYNLDKCIPGQTALDPEVLDLSSDSEGDRSLTEPHIFVLDSLGGRQKKCTMNINDYLAQEAASRLHVEPTEFIKPRFHYASVPRQDNSCDCGVFLLHFVDQFLNSPQSFIDILLTKNATSPLWKADEIKDKRKELQDLFLDIHSEYVAAHVGKLIM